MRTSPRLALALCALACASLRPGLAQTPDAPMPSGAPGGAATPEHAGRGRHGRQGQSGQPGHARQADMKIPAEAWPRLEPGALLCTSLDGLRARAEALEADGGPQPLPPGCRPIARATKVTVLGQPSPGATEVSLDATRERGWTDAWLPDRPPPPPGR